VTPSSPFDEFGEHELPEAADAPVTAGAQTSDVTEAVVEVRRQVTGTPSRVRCRRDRDRMKSPQRVIR